jgi:hypothetical protein
MQAPPSGSEPPQTYSQPPPPAAPLSRPTNSLAIVSLVAGIASYFVVPIIGAVIAIVTGHMARAQIRRTGEEGKGLALIGLILGYAHLALAVLVGAILLLVVGGIFLAATSAH